MRLLLDQGLHTKVQLQIRARLSAQREAVLCRDEI